MQTCFITCRAINDSTYLTILLQFIQEGPWGRALADYPLPPLHLQLPRHLTWPPWRLYAASGAYWRAALRAGVSSNSSAAAGQKGQNTVLNCSLIPSPTCQACSPFMMRPQTLHSWLMFVANRCAPITTGSAASLGCVCKKSNCQRDRRGNGRFGPLPNPSHHGFSSHQRLDARPSRLPDLLVPLFRLARVQLVQIVARNGCGRSAMWIERAHSHLSRYLASSPALNLKRIHRSCRRAYWRVAIFTLSTP